MFINDVGQNTWEEVNVGGAGRNYGWPGTEGDFNQASFPNFTRPLYAYSHGGGTFQGFAITGGAFYNPAANQFPAEYAGDYFFADYVNDWIRRYRPRRPTSVHPSPRASGPRSTCGSAPTAASTTCRSAPAPCFASGTPPSPRPRRSSRFASCGRGLPRARRSSPDNS